MISHGARHHNAAASTLVTLLALSLVGCGGGGDDQHDKQAAEPRRDLPCGVACDDSAWRQFVALGTRATAGDDLAQAELTAYGELPVLKTWRASMAPDEPAALRVGNWLEATFWQELGRSGEGKLNTDRRIMSRSWRYSWEHRAEVEAMIARYTHGPEACRLREFASLWLEPGELPSPLPVAFLPGRDELRHHDNTVLVDTGVLIAGRPDQLKRQITALLRRALHLLDGPNPLSEDGRLAVAHTLRVIQGEGISAWIEDRPNAYFRPDHYRLGKVAPVPENFFETGIRTMDRLNANLPAMLADPAVMTRRGQELARAVTAGGGLSHTGYCLAATIAGQLGEDRLREVSRSVPAFMAAYQEAALQNPVPRPRPGTLDHALYETMPPFTAEVFAGLAPLLAEVFPQ